MSPANIDTMMYAGETPWHGLGVKLDNPATSEEAIAAAGLDWEVVLAPIFVYEEEQLAFKAILRKDTRRVFAIAKNRYMPVQNQRAFSFFDSVVGEGLAAYHTAGALGKGEKVWILAKLNGQIDVQGDKVDKFILLINSHDMSSPLKMFWTPIRVVCQNTLGMAETGIRDSLEIFSVRHTTHLDKRINQARNILGLANNYFERFAFLSNKLASQKMGGIEIPKYLNFVFGQNENLLQMGEVYSPGEERERVKILRKDVSEARDKVKELMERGIGLGHGNDKWNAYNAVVEYVDYYKKARSKREGARLSMVWFGSGAQLKERARRYLLEEIEDKN